MSKTLGEKIKELRNSKGWSLDELAQQSNVSKAYLSQLENGESERPSAEILYKIATTLGTSISSLLGKTLVVEDDPNEIMDNLRKAQLKYGIPENFLGRLAASAKRTDDKKGRKDYSPEDWNYLYETLRRIDRESGEQSQ